MKEIKTYYNLLLSATGPEHWEIKIVEVNPGEYWGSAVAINRNQSFSWRKFGVATEQDAYDELIKLTEGNLR